ncbi:unnamed protein product, partial [Closterium sp. NIES-53]
MHLLPEVDCGPKVWTVLKELHTPTSIASFMLERELPALRLSEGEPVQPVLDKMRDLYAKLAVTGITYPEQTKWLKTLSLLPETWLQFTSGLSLPQNQSLWTLVWLRTKILEEDFLRRQPRGDPSAKVRAELHPIDYLVLDTGAAWTMMPRMEMIDDVRAAPINEVCSTSGQALKVAGVGRAAFKRADSKPVVPHDVLLIPDLKANLIFL